MLKYLLEKEFKQLLRNKFIPRFVIAFPFIILLVFPLAANFEVKDLRVCVVDCDRSPFSRRLEAKLAGSRYFRLGDVVGSFDEARARIERGSADLVLEVPAGFERRLSVEGEASLMISADAVNGVKGGLGAAYLTATVNEFADEARRELVGGQTRFAAPRFEIRALFRHNPRLEYPIYMAPALMVMLMAMLCGFLPALNIVSEKESGTIEQMNVTPVGKFSLILSKLIPYWVVGFIALTICFGVAFVAYGLAPRGGILAIYVFATLFSLAFSGFGLVISNYGRSIQQAMFMMFFFVITFVLISGLYTPAESMPDWAQVLSRLSPLRYFIQVMRLVYLKGSGLGDLLPQLGALASFAVLFNGWAILSYRKKS